MLQLVADICTFCKKFVFITVVLPGVCATCLDNYDKLVVSNNLSVILLINTAQRCDCQHKNRVIVVVVKIW